MRISSKTLRPLDKTRESSDRDVLTSQVSAIADLQVANENITASGSHRKARQMSPELAAFTKEQILKRAVVARIAPTMAGSEAILERKK